MPTSKAALTSTAEHPPTWTRRSTISIGRSNVRRTVRSCTRGASIAHASARAVGRRIYGRRYVAAKPAAERALQLDPDLPEAHFAAAIVQTLAGSGLGGRGAGVSKKRSR